MYSNELMHYGVLGMKWGVRRSRADYKQSRERRKIDKKLKDPRSLGKNISSVMGKRSAIVLNNKEVSAKWKAASKAGARDKEIEEYEAAVDYYINKANKQLKREYVDAFIKDAKLDRLTEQGRVYVEEHIEQIMRY